MVTEDAVKSQFLKIQEMYLSMLNNKFIFEKKCDLLKVYFIKEETSRTHATTKETFKGTYEIIISFNELDSKNFISFVMAHELSHLLFTTINQINISDYCASDDSFAKTNVVRISKNQEYGNVLEEVIGDYFALEVVYRLNNFSISKDELIKEFYIFHSEPFTSTNIEYMSKIITMFGADISSCDKLDDIVENGQNATPKNLFTYAITTGVLGLLINDYDECMGKEAWKNFVKKLDTFFSDNNDKSSKENIDVELLRFKILSDNS